MTLLIDVGTVLRGTVCDLYSNLVTRPTGAAVRTAIEQQVSEVGEPVVTTIDFSQVNMIDFSCADEIVAKLLLRFTSSDGPQGSLLFCGIQDDHLDPIETVLAHHKLALVSWFEGTAELFGTVEEIERAHWEAVRDHGPLTADAIAAMLGQEPADSAAVLTRLQGRRLLMRQDDRFSIPSMVREAA
jgi:hypothetical protein